MSEVALGIITMIVSFALAYAIAWDDAHREVGRECDRLGGFYVGENTYECKLKAKGE